MIESSNHWWQNWPKTHAFVAEKMFFPKTVGEIALAVQTAEADKRPLRAVGGGWSFSDASLPGNVTTNRPNVRGVEAITAVLPEAQRFPTDRTKPSVASVTRMASTGPPDGPGTMVMLDMRVTPPAVDPAWGYLGTGLWRDPTGNLRGTPGGPGFLDWLAKGNVRPIRTLGGLCLEEGDTAGSLVMLDLNENATVASRDWCYKGNGVWMVGVSADGATPDEGTLEDLSRAGRLTRPGGMNLSPRAADPADVVSVLLSKAPYTSAPPEPVYLLNTRSLVSSLQQRLPSILSASALDETSETPSTGKRRYLFHVEAGITIAELGQLLAHQSPRLALLAISGSPGATLAGAISTGTHGAEFNWPLLIDTVKAVHLVGPGGLQWWIEGDEAIADPQKLHALYPEIDPSRIIRGAQAVGGVVPADWLGAAVVSLGCLGVLYSVVLEVVPLFGVREVVVQKTWKNLGFLGTRFADKDVPTLLRDPETASVVSSRIVKLMQAGNLNGTQIPQVDALGNLVNQYADLAINPIPRPDGDFDCWIANREVTAQLPLDTQPAASLFKGIAKAFEPADRKKKLGQVFGLSDILSNPPTWPAELIDKQGQYKAMLGRVTRASDLVDVALETLLSPMSNLQGSEVAQALLTGILSGLLGTANCDRRADATGVSVGNLGFPESGVMGTALEISLSPADAFGFVQTEILDKTGRNKPFYGYISIRLCSKTHTLMGMQQFGDATNPVSVMVEVVGFANDYAREFMHDLQKRTAARIDKGLDAMLHWGLENDAITAKALGATKALQAQSRSGMPKLSTFKAVRALLHAAAPSRFRVFDNAFTERLGLSSPSTGLAFCDENGTAISEWIPTAWNVPPGTPLVENHAAYLQELYLVNQSDRWVHVDSVRVVSSADAPGAPVFTLQGPQPPFQVPIRSFMPVLPLALKYMGAPAGPLTGTVLVECDRPIGPTVTIDFATTVTANRHAELRVTPGAVDFGTTLVGADVGQYLELANTGTYDAVIDGIAVTLDQPPGQFTLPMVLPTSVPVGESRKVYVVFSPAGRGFAQATLAIDTHSRTDITGVEDRRRYDIPLTGLAQAAELFLSLRPRGRPATTLDFGSAPLSTTVNASFWIRNVGDAALVVQDVLEYDHSTFGITDASIFPATLQPGGMMEVECTFLAPPVPGFPAASLLHVRTNDPRQRQDPTVGDLIVKGRAAGAHLTNPPEVLMLGTEAPLATSADLVFRSDGTDPVKVESAKLVQSNDFAVTAISPGNAVPLQVDPGKELTVTVALTATQPGSYQSRLLVMHDGSPGGESQVIMNGYVA